MMHQLLVDTPALLRAFAVLGIILTITGEDGDIVEGPKVVTSQSRQADDFGHGAGP